MKRLAIIAFLILACVLGFSQYSLSASFDLSTNKIFTPQEEPTITISSMDVPALDIRLYKIDDPQSYFLDLSDVHSPTMKTKRELSSPSEMAGGVKRKVLGLFRDDYRSVLSDDIRKEVVSALGLPHASEPESPEPQSYELYPVLDQYKLINRWEERLVYTKRGQWEYHEIPIKVDGTGVYLVEAIYQDMVAYTAVVVSSVAFIVKNSPTDDLVYVTDRVTGEPERGVKVSIFGTDKKPLTSGRTNRDGIFYAEADIGENYSLYVFAEKGDDFTLADPYTYFWWSDSKDKVYTYTDRPVYRPNHTVYFRSIIRETKKSGLEVPDKDDTYLVIIKDSKGNEVYRKELPINEFGSLSGDFKLGPEPPLGEYDIIVFFNDINFYSYFKVEEYKKPEFEVKVETDSDVYIRGTRITAKVDAKYYFGSPVSGGQVEYSIYRSVYERPWWWGYEWGWYFMDDDYYWTHDRVMVDSGSAVLDEDGKLTIKVDTSRFAEGDEDDYTFTIEAVVTDLSRREVSGSTAVKVARSSFSMIVRANRWIYSPGDEATVTVSAIDFDNKGVGGVNVTLIATEMDQQRNVVTSSQTLTGVTEPDGEVTFKYQVKGTGRVDFVATSFDRLGNFTTSKDYAYCYDWARGYAGDISEGSISIIPDKDTYALGDTAHILIISPVEDTYMLVTTEGLSINDAHVMKIKGGSAMFDLKIEDKHTPNMFVTASMIFNDELYTETKRVVIPPEHKFINIEITSDKEVYEPQEEGTFKIKTTDSKGKPISCEVSLGMVDDAIYAISPETVVEIEKYFYKLYPHIVETSSSLYFSFYGYSHRKGLLAALEEKETTLADFKGETLVEPRIRKDFKDTMYWSPSVKTGIDGTATVTLKFPDNLTRWRATVRGVTKESEVGEMTYRVISRKDLIVRIETPRFFRQGDELIISTIAHNYLSEDKKVKFTLDISGLELLGGAPKEVIVPKNSEKRIDWKVRAKDVGSAVLTAKAMTNEESDGMEVTVPILPMGIRVTENDMREIVKDSGSLRLVFTKPKNSIKNAAVLKIDVSPTLVNTMLSAIPFLVGYPYGCNEQVMSRFLPSVMVSSLLNKLDLEYEGIEKDLPDYINSGLSVLYKRQHDDDGWGWYEDDETDSYMTAYVLYGLIEASRILPETDIDIKVDENVIKKGTASLISQLDDIDEDSVRVYALYVLSHTDSLKLEWLDEMFAKADELTAISKAMLLLAYENMGIEGKARSLYDMLLAERIEENGYVHWGYTGEEFYWWQWEADELETTAYMLAVMAKRDIENPLITKAIRWLVINRTGSYWRSTKASGKIIYAMSEYLSRTGEMNPDYDLSLTLNGKELVDVHVNKNNMLGDFTSIIVPDDKLKTGENIIEVKKDGPGSVYYSSAFTYYTDVGDIYPLSSGFDVRREYYLLKKEIKGNEITYVKEPLTGPVSSGDEILVKLDVTTDNYYTYFLLEDYFPAGCEALKDDDDYIIAGDDFYDGGYHYWYAGREIRDDRIGLSRTYMDEGTHTFKYILRAQIPGVFSVMPSEASLMYYPDRYGRTGSSELVINEAK